MKCMSTLLSTKCSINVGNQMFFLVWVSLQADLSPGSKCKTSDPRKPWQGRWWVRQARKEACGGCVIGGWPVALKARSWGLTIWPGRRGSSGRLYAPTEHRTVMTKRGSL